MSTEIHTLEELPVCSTTYFHYTKKTKYKHMCYTSIIHSLKEALAVGQGAQRNTVRTMLSHCIEIQATFAERSLLGPYLTAQALLPASSRFLPLL